MTPPWPRRQLSPGQSGTEPPVGSPPLELYPELDRRFEAVVMCSAAPETLAHAAPPLKAPAQTGVLVGVIAPLAVDDLRGLLQWPTVGVADLVVAVPGVPSSTKGACTTWPPRHPPWTPGGAELVAVGWRQTDDPSRGAVARKIIDRSPVPVLLVAVA